MRYIYPLQMGKHILKLLSCTSTFGYLENRSLWSQCMQDHVGCVIIEKEKFMWILVLTVSIKLKGPVNDEGTAFIIVCSLVDKCVFHINSQTMLPDTKLPGMHHIIIFLCSDPNLLWMDAFLHQMLLIILTHWVIISYSNFMHWSCILLII